MVDFQVLPINLAYCGKCCAKCCENNGRLLKCTSCKQAFYCSKDCQKSDWKKHKVECKLLKAFKAGYDILPGSPADRQTKAHNFLQSVPLLLMGGSDPNLPTMEQFEKADTARFIGFATCRACSICLKNDFQSPAAIIDWKCCPQCNYGWCCGEQHWQEYSGRHTTEICQKYQQATAIALFKFKHIVNFNENFLAMPQRPQRDSPTAFPTNWEAYFQLRFAEDYRPNDYVPGFYAASTSLLSQPVTCLYAMFKYGKEHFITKKELTIHIVGADTYEVPATHVWEEILHFLPQVQTLTIQFVGPAACKSIKPPTQEYPTKTHEPCPDCQARRRERQVGMFGYTYHEYEQLYLQTHRHNKPDLIVAFNSGIHEVDTESWKTSLQVILGLNVPTYFTSYNESEAVKDLALLREQNANLLQENVKQNPFGENFWTIEAPSLEMGVDKFFACNMYGTLFCGRSS